MVRIATIFTKKLTHDILDIPRTSAFRDRKLEVQTAILNRAHVPMADDFVCEIGATGICVLHVHRTDIHSFEKRTRKQSGENTVISSRG